ncbi:SusC/RagA family TonB-linked outer membrane protein [Pedobacter foliorum]|uniref:SusC/RagA family TonB-linked outer membrane protein n=1 Tax=Pedobacter foliorum TaxID=2739058 RepID=UPI0015663B37|nr:SusC/RagA family TonB-linked outer membrane protein [Pedobacter foliorum]NRF41754.1 SusC/RagA family TonB-linked outer membrane protein [Pedobacter foliorum]
MKRKLLLFSVMCLLFAQAALAQNLIKGVVKDTKGDGIPGVSVSVADAKKATVTDFEGKYSISAAADATLSFTYLGYISQNISVAGKSQLDVTLLEDSKTLGEVVVTAIGIKQQKKKLGYATQEVKTDVLSESKTMNIGNALTGQVAGLTVNNPTGMFQSPSFSLRGKNPLIVIDGIPVETDFFDVSGDNIANINVLKGTTASALYGSRGRNGAILITTKNADKDGLEININTNNMVTAGFTVFPKTQTEYGNGSNGKYEFWDGEDGGISDGDMIWGPKFQPGVKIAQWNSPLRNKQTGETIEWYGNVKGTIYDDKSKYERVPTDWVRHDNLNDFLRPGIVTNNDFSVAYKGAKAQFYASGKYGFQRGQVPNTSLTTGGINFNSSFNLASNLQLDATLSYNKVSSPNYPRYGYGPKNHMYTILIWMGDDVNGKDLRDHMYVPGMEGYRQANYNYAWYNNPYFASEELTQATDRNVLSGQAKLRWQVTPGLSLQARASGREKKSFDNMKSPKSYMNYGDSRNGDYKMWNNSQMNVDLDFLASYNKEISKDLTFTLNAGASTFNRDIQQEYASSDGLIVPFVYSLNNTQGPVQATNYLEQKSIRSVYGSANFDIFNAVYLNLTGRNDWSSTLSKENRSYFYPSASLSTMVSDYIKMPKALDYLKLYTSWAKVSDDLAPYSIASTYTKDVTYGTTPSVTYPAGLINPNIKPEQSTSYEVGLSTSLVKKVGLEFTYYNVIDENKIIDPATSEASGFKTRKVNGNKYKTQGLEIMANYNAIKRDDFKWDIAVNWSTSERKLTEIYDNQPKFGDLKLNDRADSFYGTVWQKSATGEVILDPNTGLPTRDNFNVNLGHSDPSWRLGLQNKFMIKGFDVNIDIDGAWGGVMRSVTIEKMWWGGKHPSSVEFRDAEYAAGKAIYVPEGVVITGGELKRDVNGKVLSDTRTYKKNTTAVNWQTWSQIYPYQARVTEEENKKFANVFDRSFFKLRRISVGYDLAKVIKMGSLKSVHVSAYSYNPLMWKKMPLLDPDYGDDNNLQDPSARFIGLSLSVKL